MVFSSTTFLFAFLPLVLLATWVTPARFRRFVLLLASLAFYVWGVQEFVIVVIASTLVDWALALAIRQAQQNDRPLKAAVLLTLGVLQNLALLGYFKYVGFFSEQLAELARLLGEPAQSTLSIALPIGISFFTFEKISYVVDVWRRDVEPRRDPSQLLLFVFLFPRSIAGPIVRFREIQHELQTPRPRADQIGDGAIRFGHGLAKKVLIADQIAPVADAAFASTSNGGLTTTAAWIGALAYTLQLYYDFSGYSDMAIGIGMMLGFRLPENFNRPYSAVSITDFWRRWHITLSRWFRDYLYIPLGGSRHGSRTTYRNLLIVFGLTGLWHGAEWTFVLWGFYHGAWMLIERRMGWRGIEQQVRHVVLRRIVTFLIVMFGWVLFRAGSVDVALDYYRAMFVPTGGSNIAMREALDNQAVVFGLIGLLIVALPGTRSGGRWLVEAVGRVPSVARVISAAVLMPLALVYAFTTVFSPFLYFQF